MLVVLDTGILLRVPERTDPQHLEIRSALRLLRGHGHTFATTAQNLAEFWNVCTRPTSARGGLGLSIEETERRLRLLERNTTILTDTADVYTQWKQIVVNQSVRGVQVHDARLAALMTARGLTHLLTLNVADFRRYPGIIALSPADVIAGNASPTP
jgi:predicted nucleic acid-binding protein